MPYARLDERGVLSVTGDEAHTFLQALITADLDQLAVGEMRPSALLTPQGKILFDFLIGKIDGGFRIETARAALPDLLKRFTLYWLRARVEIAEQPEEAVFAIWEEDGAAIQGAQSDRRFTTTGVYRLYGIVPEGIQERPASEFQALRVGAGIAEAETDYPRSEMFPHDVLLDQNGGVSFRKGCFVGQEVVSRMQHRGTARRRLMLVSAERHLTPGSVVLAGDRPLGDVLASIGRDGFAVLRIDRLAAALAEGVELSADGVPVETGVPPWAGFNLPDLEGVERSVEPLSSPPTSGSVA